MVISRSFSYRNLPLVDFLIGYLFDFSSIAIFLFLAVISHKLLYFVATFALLSTLCITFNCIN